MAALAAAAMIPLSGQLAADPVVPLEVVTYPQNMAITANGIHGRLYVPPSHNEPGDTAQYKLVVAFHGQGNWFHKNNNQTNNGDEPYKMFKNLLLRAEQEGFMVYIPQIIANSEPGAWSYRNLDSAMRVVSRLSTTYRIDLDRIYFTGASLGGGGIWRAMHRYSGLTAASLSICASENSTVNKEPFYEPIVDIPILAFHALNDGPKVPCARTESHINMVRRAAGLNDYIFPETNPVGGDFIYQVDNITYRRPTVGGHTIWGATYLRNDVYQWLFSHTNDRLGNLEIGESVFFDLGRQTASVLVNGVARDFGSAMPDANGDIWSASNLQFVKNVDDCLIPFAKTTDGKQTVVSLDLKGGFETFHESEETEMLYGPLIGSDGYITKENATETTHPGKLKVRGLVPGAPYRVEVYGFNEDDDSGNGRETTYRIGSQTRDLECALNLDETAVFASVVADSEGAFEMLVYKTPGTDSRFGQINNLKVTRLDPAVLHQDFEASDVVADYVPSGDPGNWGFHDIDSEVEGGVWSIVESSLPGVPGQTSRRLVLTRPDGSTAGINGAGVTRFAANPGNEPEVVAVGFDMMTLLTPMIGYNAVLATLDVGNITSVLDYSSATPGASTAARLNIRGVLSGSTSRWRFASETDSGEVLLPTSYSQSFDMGSEVRVVWMVNAGSSSYEYARPDDPQTTRVLAGGSGDLWVTSGTAGPVLINTTNLMRHSTFTSPTAGGLRFRGRTPRGVVISIDNLTVIPLR